MAAIIVRPDGSTSSGIFDAVIRIAYSESDSVTDNPVESGVTPSDHAQKNPLLISMTAIVSTTPFAAVATVGGAARLQAAETFLQACRAELVSLVDDVRGTATSLQITRFAWVVDVKKRWEFGIEFKQVRIATATTVVLPAAVAETAMPEKKENGALPTKAVTGVAQEEEDTSILYDVGSALGVL